MSAYEISVISVIGINVILAVSLNMISGFCGQISLGHGAFYGAGAYAAALAMIGAGSVPLALLAAAIVGSVLGTPVTYAGIAYNDTIEYPDQAGKCATRLLGIEAIFGADLPGDQRFTKPVVAHLAALFDKGAKATAASLG